MPVATVNDAVFFGGSNLDLEYGGYPDIALRGIPNNSISSAKVSAGTRMILYADKNFQGEKLILDGPVTMNYFTGVKTWNDITSSIEVMVIPASTAPAPSQVHDTGGAAKLLSAQTEAAAEQAAAEQAAKTRAVQLASAQTQLAQTQAAQEQAAQLAAVQAQLAAAKATQAAAAAEASPKVDPAATAEAAAAAKAAAAAANLAASTSDPLEAEMAAADAEDAAAAAADAADPSKKDGGATDMGNMMWAFLGLILLVVFIAIGVLLMSGGGDDEPPAATTAVAVIPSDAGLPIPNY